MSEKSDENWVFGYGSLMWRPGFDFIEKSPATLTGYHRSLCVYSYVHRGTKEVPGLVLGLDNGGHCHGIAYRVAKEHWEDTIEYLREREQATAVYIESTQKVELSKPAGRTVKATTYLVDHNHEQYAGVLTHDALLKFIHQGKGQSGHCRDYILATSAHLDQLDVKDRTIKALAEELSQ